MKKITAYHVLVSLLVLILLLSLANYLIILSLVKENMGLFIGMIFLLLLVALVMLANYLLFKHFKIVIPKITKFIDKIAQGQLATEPNFKTGESLTPLLTSLLKIVQNIKM